MSAVLGGFGAVSSAMTNRPACLAWLSAALTASPLVVIRMPLSPRAIALSVAVIWLWVSPSLVPAATVRFTLSLAAAVLASFSMLTKYGLVSVLRISETPTAEPEPEPEPPEPAEVLPEEELQAARAATAHNAVAAAAARVRRLRRGAWVLVVELSMVQASLGRTRGEGGGRRSCLTCPGAARSGIREGREIPREPRDNVVSPGYSLVCDNASSHRQRPIGNESVTQPSGETTMPHAEPGPSRPAGRPTMRDVAALAGVAIKTVSRVVNGVSTVDPALAARVREAADKLGYRPNLTASNLRRSDGRTATIGMLVEDAANPFSAALMRA